MESRTTVAVGVFKLDKIPVASEHCIWKRSPCEKQGTVMPERLMPQCSKAKQNYVAPNVRYKTRIESILFKTS